MKEQKIIRVFVASPGDVGPEREILEEITKELNDLWGDSLGVHLHLIKWETHSWPAIGTDPQAVINEQIGNNYEVFIGILWSRFGTPTPRAESGTAEEFDQAFSKFKENPESIKVMFYFKDQPVSPSEIDPEQLIRIIKFKNKLGELGSLHWTFNNTEEFSKYLRMHLSRQMQHWKDRPLEAQDSTLNKKNQLDELVPIIEKAEIIEEEGFLDLVELGIENFEMLSEVSHRMTDEMTKLAKHTANSTIEMQSIDMSQGKGDLKKAKRLVNQMAAQIESFNERFKVETPLYQKHFITAIDAYGKASTLLTDFDEDVDGEINNAIETVIAIKNASNGVREAILEYRQIIVSLPRITTRFNRAKRSCISILDNFNQEIESGINLTIEVENTMNNLLI